MIDWNQVISCKPFEEAYSKAKNTDNTDYNATYTDYLLRDRVWKFYDEFLLDRKKRSISDWAHGICSVQNFYQKILPHSARLNWILSPPLEQFIFNDVLKEKALDRAMKILEIEAIDDNGKVCCPGSIDTVKSIV